MALGLLLAVFIHAPLLGALGEALPGEAASDVFRAHWTVWLVAEELPGWPFSTEWVGFPGGSSLLPFPAVSLLAISPLTGLFGADVSLSLLVVLYTVFAFVGAWFLVRTLGGGPGGGALAGSLFCSQPILSGSLFDGTVEMLAVGWMPVFIAAMFRAVQGSVRWGVSAGGLFLLICLESVYLGSFCALAVFVVLTRLRTVEGIRAAGASALTVVVGLGVLSVLFWPVFANIGDAMATSGDDLEQIRAGNAVSLDGIWYLAKNPGARGWIVGDIYAPPLAHWAAFGLLGLVALRRAHWLVALGGLYLLLAVNSGLMSWWVQSPIGEVVRFPRRYLIGTTLCFSVAAGLSTVVLKRWVRVEWLLGIVLGFYLGWWGKVAGGLGSAYPLAELPERPAFASWIASDDENASVLLIPQQLPQEEGGNAEGGAGGENLRICMPVFAQLAPMEDTYPCRSERSSIASSDHVWLQTQFQKPAWFAPSLVTLAREEAPNILEKNLTDLARGKLGMSLPQSAKAKPESYSREMKWLQGLGLKYVVVDVDRFRASELEQVDKVLSHYAVETRSFEDGTGVRVYRLYDERPEEAKAPRSDVADPTQGGFFGQITNVQGVDGIVSLVIQSDEAQKTCFTRPENGAFHCGFIDPVDAVWVRINQTYYTVEMTEEEDGSRMIRALEPVQ